MIDARREMVARSPVAAALSHRLTLVLAAAGWGKSTLLAQWAAATPAITLGGAAATRSPAALARSIAEALQRAHSTVSIDDIPVAPLRDGPEAEGDALALAEAVGRLANVAISTPTLLIIDDLDIDDRATAEFVVALLDHAPADLHVVIAARRASAMPLARLRASAGVQVLTTRDLAVRVTDFEHADLSLASLDSLGALIQATSGWPVVAALALELLQRDDTTPGAPDALARRLLGSTEVLFDYLAVEVHARQSERCRSVLALAAWLPFVDAAVLQAIGQVDLTPALTDAVEVGAFLEPAAQGGPTPAWKATVLGAEFLRPLCAPPTGDTLEQALQHFVATGNVGEACEFVLIHQSGDLAARLAEHTADLDRVDARVVLDVLELGARSGDTTHIAELRGDAHFRLGAWTAALSDYRAAGQLGDPRSSRLCRKMAVVHYLRGESDEADEVCATAHVDSPPTVDDAALLAWHAAVKWITGDVDGCRSLTAAAEKAALAHRDDRAIATAYTAKAMLAAFEGDRRANGAWYRSALDHATRAGDTLQMARIRSNLGSHYIEEGKYQLAVEELDVAIDVAERNGMAMFAALAYVNRGEAQMLLGQLEAATVDLRNAHQLWDRAESDFVSYALSSLGEVHLLRGQTTEAGVVFRRALELSERRGDVQGLASSLVGLSRCELTHNPITAMEFALRAVAVDNPIMRPAAELACGWAALHSGDHEMAVKRARLGRELGAVNSDRTALAESLLLEAAVGAPDAARLAAEARTLWRELANPIGEARAIAAVAASSPAGKRRALLREAEDLLTGCGAGALIESVLGEHRPTDVVRVQVLGGFTVTRGGVQVDHSEWGSRKARDLFRYLVAKAGRSTSRSEIAEALWPDETTDTTKRLAVLVSTVRAVLDPTREQSPDWVVGADDRALWLVTDHVDLDATRVVELCAEGRRSLRAGDRIRAERTIGAALSQYRGEAFEDDPYSPWTDGVRARCRHAITEAAHDLAAAVSADGRHADAVALALRLVELDPFDEQAHRRLIRSLSMLDRHGEARRAYRQYAARMTELGFIPASFAVASSA